MSVPPRPAGRAALPAPPGPLVGRAGELGLLAGLLADRSVRLTTLTGPPGVGKTRLAVAAASLREQAGDDVLFVDLTAVRDPELVPGEIAAAVGPVPSGGSAGAVRRLIGALTGRSVLIVLDNMEQVLAAAPALGELLTGAPGVRLLVTSRERLRLRAEHEVPLPPLALPTPEDVADPARLAATPSVALLVAQVRGFQPGFAVTPANRAALAEICVRLDGLPLALELAAPRLRLFSPGELVVRLRGRAAQLASDARDAPQRHRTLRSALAWSHDLLDADERTMFHQLAVFTGSWTLEAAERVATVPDPLGTLASLTDKSLVRRLPAPGGGARFGMLESLREFAAEQLDEDGGTEEARARHAGYFAERAGWVDAQMGTPEETAAIDEVGFDIGNLRAAQLWAIGGSRPALALPLALGIGWHAWTRGQLGSGRETLEAAIAAATAGGTPPDDPLAGALFMAGAVALAQGDLEAAEERMDASLALVERAGSARRRALVTAFLGHLARARGRHDEAATFHESAGRLYEELGSARGVAWSRYDLGLLARRRGEHDRAADLLRPSLTVFRDLDYGWAIGHCAWALASVELRRGQAGEAAALLTEALDGLAAVGDARGVAQCLEETAALAIDRSAYRAAGRLLGAAAMVRDSLGAPLPEEEQEAHDAVVARLRGLLGHDAVEAAQRAGRGMPWPAAVGLARGVLAVPDPAGPPGSALTPREREVARLVRQGATNRQIGGRLGISEKTTEVHVHHIIAKLGVSSRAGIAVWVAAREGPADTGAEAADDAGGPPDGAPYMVSPIPGGVRRP